MFRLSVLFCNCNRPLPTYQFNCCLRKNLRILHNCIATKFSRFKTNSSSLRDSHLSGNFIISASLAILLRYSFARRFELKGRCLGAVRNNCCTWPVCSNVAVQFNSTCAYCLLALLTPSTDFAVLSGNPYLKATPRIWIQLLCQIKTFSIWTLKGVFNVYWWLVSL